MPAFDRLSPWQQKDVLDFLTSNTPCKSELEARQYASLMMESEILQAYLNWNGIIGFDEMIKEIVLVLYGPTDRRIG